MHRDEIFGLQASFQVQQNTVTMHFAEHGVIDDQQVISLRKVGKAGMAEFVEGAFVPLDAYLRVQFLVPLRSGNQGRQGTAVIPGNSAQFESCHTHCSVRLGIRTFCPFFAEMQAASTISIAATPSHAGERLQDGSTIESMRLMAGALCG